MVAISHFVHHNSLPIHEEITFVKNNEYIQCFNQTKNVFNMNIPKKPKPVKVMCHSTNRYHLQRHKYLFNKCMRQLKEMKEILEEDD